VQKFHRVNLFLKFASNAKRRSRVTFWTTACWSEEHAASKWCRSYLRGRVDRARRVCTEFPCLRKRIKRSAERIKAVPDGIILDDLQPRLVCHVGWNALDVVEKKGKEARPVACLRAPLSHAPQSEAPQMAQVATLRGRVRVCAALGRSCGSPTLPRDGGSCAGWQD